MSKYRVFSGPHFLVFRLNTRKYGPENTPYLDTFHALKSYKYRLIVSTNDVGEIEIGNSVIEIVTTESYEVPKFCKLN